MRYKILRKISLKELVTQMTANGDVCLKHRVVIEFLIAEKDIPKRLKAVYGNNAVGRVVKR